MGKQQSPTILLVDGFIPLSKLLTEPLQHLGFTVFCAANPEDGLALFQEQKAKIDLVTIDILSPKAGNLDLTAELERLRPGLPVLYIAGARMTVARCSLAADTPDFVLVAPFTAKEFIQRVEDLLQRSQAVHRQQARASKASSAGGGARSAGGRSSGRHHRDWFAGWASLSGCRRSCTVLDLP